jgi:hypothetical protein
MSIFKKKIKSMHLHITTDGYDAKLYVNDKLYQDMDTTWYDCIKFLADILPKNIKITCGKMKS